MTLTQLEYVLAVAKERNFHRAAQACHVTQPTLSALIKKLELELDVLIFDRSKSPTTLTQLGESIVEQAKIVLLEAGRISELIAEQRDEVKGELRVGIIPTIAPYLLPLFLANFRKAYPLIDLSVSELTTEDCLKALDSEEIDLAILATREDKNSFFQEPIYEEKMYLFINSEHPLAERKKISMDDLKAEDMWLLEEGHCLRDEIVKLCHLRKIEKKRPHGLDIKIGSLESLRYLVQENFGYTLIPELASLRIPSGEKKLLRSFVNSEPTRKINFTTKRRYLRKALISALKTEVSRVVRSKLA